MGVMQSTRMQLAASALVLGYLALVPAFLSDPLVTRSYYLWQDRYVAIGLIACFAGAAVFAGWVRVGLPGYVPGRAPILLAAASLVLLAWWGTYAVMLDYPLTRDEVSAWFDSLIFARGLPARGVDAPLRPYLDAMVVAFHLPMEGNVAVVSAYMPGNAAMRALFELLSEPQLLNPVLLGVGLVALWDVARRLFADVPSAAWVVIACYILSAQVLVNAMTSYAMMGHLAFNLVWLALYLRDRWWSHALAMLIGAWAIGLHQIIFHPLFAGPFLLLFPFKGRWRLFAVYALVYATALLGWMNWYGFVRDFVGAQPPPSEGEGVAGFLRYRVLSLLFDFNSYALPLMMYNLLRFFTWMPAFFLPLALAALPLSRRYGELPFALWLGIALTFVAMLWLLPYQGHGWGYRYFHAVLPNAILLAGYGYRIWRQRDPREADGLVVVLGAASLLLQMPFLFWQAHRFVAPYAALTARIERQEADFLVIETRPPGSAIDQVRNRPDFSNVPLVFTNQLMDQDMIVELCRRGTVTMIRHDQYRLPQFGYSEERPNDNVTWLLQWLPRQRCWREPAP